MTAHSFIFVLASGSAAVALWVNCRFPKLMPWSMAKLFVHLVIALLVVYAVSPVMGFVTGSGLPNAQLAAVFLVGFPALVYEFLVGAWLIRLAQATGGGFRA